MPLMYARKRRKRYRSSGSHNNGRESDNKGRSSSFSHRRQRRLDKLAGLVAEPGREFELRPEDGLHRLLLVSAVKGGPADTGGRGGIGCMWGEEEQRGSTLCTCKILHIVNKCAFLPIPRLFHLSLPR